MKTTASHIKQRASRSVSPWQRSSSILPAINALPVRADPTQRPSISRLRRPVGQWLPLGRSSVSARIVVLQHGGHQRPVIHRGSKHLRFRFASTKTKTTQLGEGKGEEALAHYNEVATEVADYECHPYQFEFQRPCGFTRYRPDCVRVFRDGRVEVIEVKRTATDLDDPDDRERLALAAEICRQCGWGFRILFLNDILGSCARQLNVAALYTRRSMQLSRDEERVASHIIANSAPITWGELRDRLAPNDPLQGDAAIERLLARGMLSTDLDLKFTPVTLLFPTHPSVGVSEIRL